MSGSAVNRGGVRFDFTQGADPGWEWWARMRNHAGHGSSIEAATEDLIASIESELAAAKSARDTLKAGSADQ